ncbi:MAG: hypothetical protein ACLFR8_05300 [Alkalispirochaeta sp.]
MRHTLVGDSPRELKGGETMGDKGGKKDKAKAEKQKASRKKEDDRKKQERVPKRIP